MENFELIIMGLITHAGNARSLAIQAIRTAREGDFQQAEELIGKCEEAMLEAHGFQTKLIQSEAAGEQIPLSILMIHAQDHVMNAMTVKDLAVEMIAMMKMTQKGKEEA